MNELERKRAANLWEPFARKFPPIAKSVEMSASPNVAFEDIGGLEEAKDELLTYACAATDPQVYARWGTIPPSGLLLMGLGLIYLGAGVGICSDRPLVVLTRRELTGFFYSPVAYIVLFGLTMVGWFQYWTFIALVDEAAMERQALFEPIVRSFVFSLFPVITVIFVVPVLTMRLLSEEQAGREQEGAKAEALHAGMLPESAAARQGLSAPRSGGS